MTQPHLTILGGGPAGLATGHFARQRGFPFTIHEASDHLGGTCRTLTHGPFRFDTGAHRFHDKDPLATREVQRLLGADLARVSAPSHIYTNGRLVDFPLAPLNLLTTLGPRTSARAAVDLVRARLPKRSTPKTVDTFETFAVRTYGFTIAQAFLLQYSEKLWGLPCNRLSPGIGGSRLRNLTLTTFLTEAFRGHGAKTAHLDGHFYYPRLGFGSIVEALAASCGESAIRRRSRVTRVVHDGRRIVSVRLNDRAALDVSLVVNTLPLSLLIALLHPQPPDAILQAAAKLRFRHVVLVVLFINRPSVMRSATVYFPDAAAPFTRLYEPKNRSSAMAPADQTSLVVEVPCGDADEAWHAPELLIGRVRAYLGAIGWLNPDAIVGAATHRLPHAYPVLELGAEERAEALMTYLSRFENLRTIGRGGAFSYTHIHDMLRMGHDLVRDVAAHAGVSAERVSSLMT